MRLIIMAMPERKLSAYDQASSLVDQLSTDELIKLEKK
jgi:hypothetical protein